MAIAWTRLWAPDVALAEAAIGAGLLGVLFFDSLRVFHERGGASRERKGTGEVTPVVMAKGWAGGFVIALVLLGLLVFAGFLGRALLVMPASGGLTELAGKHLGESGVEHPVTAVLLNYRSFDTWLEIGVLVVAMLGVFCSGRLVGFCENENGSGERDRLLEWLARFLVPLLVMMAGYLLWQGKFAPGGAFQAGVLLGAAGILWHLVGGRFLVAWRGWGWKTALVGGFGLFLLHGIVSLWWAGVFLAYPEGWAGTLIFLLELGAALSIGFALLALFVYLHENDRPRKTRAREKRREVR